MTGRRLTDRALPRWREIARPQRRFWGWGLGVRRTCCRANSRSSRHDRTPRIARRALPTPRLGRLLVARTMASRRRPASRIRLPIRRTIACRTPTGSRSRDAVRMWNRDVPNPRTGVAFPSMSKSCQRHPWTGHVAERSCRAYGGGSSVCGGVEPARRFSYRAPCRSTWSD